MVLFCVFCRVDTRVKNILSLSVPRYEIASQGASSNLACVVLVVR